MLEDQDVERIIQAIEARDLARLRAAHPEDFNADGTLKLHTHSIKRRLVMVVVVMVTLVGADQVVHLEWVLRGSEMAIAAFFDWFFNVAKEGKVPIPKVAIRRKAKAAEPVE